MTGRIRLFLLIEAITYIVASLVHAGAFIDGYDHDAARNAEAIIAAVLLAGLAMSLARPALTIEAGLGAQGVALLLTLVGLFTIAVGVGPRTVPDVVYHVVIIAVLVWGLVTAWQARSMDGRTA